MIKKLFKPKTYLILALLIVGIALFVYPLFGDVDKETQDKLYFMAAAPLAVAVGLFLVKKVTKIIIYSAIIAAIIYCIVVGVAL